MLPEVAWAICSEDGDEPSEKVYVDLDVMVPLFAIVCKSSEEAFAIIAHELERHGLRAERVRIAPDNPEPETPSKQKALSIADILANSDRRRATTTIAKITDNSRRRVKSEKERKRA